MFVGKEFVLKHIRLKHIAVLDSEREKVCPLMPTATLHGAVTSLMPVRQILDEIYYDNFRKDKEEQERKMAAERERTLQFSPRVRLCPCVLQQGNARIDCADDRRFIQWL